MQRQREARRPSLRLFARRNPLTRRQHSLYPCYDDVLDFNYISLVLGGLKIGGFEGNDGDRSMTVQCQKSLIVVLRLGGDGDVDTIVGRMYCLDSKYWWWNDV